MRHNISSRTKQYLHHYIKYLLFTIMMADKLAIALFSYQYLRV